MPFKIDMCGCVSVSVCGSVCVCDCVCLGISGHPNNKFSGVLFMIFGTILGRLDTPPPMVAIWPVSQVLHVFLKSHLFYIIRPLN